MTSAELTGLKVAAKVALNSTLRVRVGATTNWGVRGWNRKHTHPLLKQWGYPEHSDIHAELDLVLNGYEAVCGRMVYVVRLLRNGEWGMAKPCPRCMAVLAHVEVRGVCWSTGDEEGCGRVRF